MRIDLIGKQHPLSPTNFKGGGSSSTSQSQTSSTTTEASTTQSGTGNIAVSNGGTVVTTSEDSGIIASAFNFAGSLVEPLLSTVNEETAAEHQTATNALNNAQSAQQEAIGQSSSIAANAQLGYSGIFENPVFIVGVVAAIGLIAFISFSNRGR